MQDTVNCQICGMPQKRITHAHLKTHGITFAEYKAKFPTAETMSKTTRQKIGNSHVGKHATEETRRKMSIARSGKNNHMYGKCGVAHPMYGKHVSEETKQKLRGKRPSISGKNHPMYGKQHSRETRERISRALTGKTIPEHVRKKISETLRGGRASDETKAKLSEIREGKRCGAESHFWQGGVSFGDYCPKFNRRLKQEIRDKYNNCDFISGLPACICNTFRKLDVHHVDYNKMQGCGEHEWRLIPLSHANHMKTNLNRPFWNTLFTYAITYDDEFNELNISHDPLLNMVRAL